MSDLDRAWRARGTIAVADGVHGDRTVRSPSPRAAAIREQPSMLAKIPEIVDVEVPGTDWSKLAEMSVRDNGA